MFCVNLSIFVYYSVYFWVFLFIDLECLKIKNFYLVFLFNKNININGKEEEVILRSNFFDD